MNILSLEEREYIRVVHVTPLQNEAHVQVLGALQVPPFWQGDAQTAERRKQ